MTGDLWDRTGQDRMGGSSPMLRSGVDFKRMSMHVILRQRVLVGSESDRKEEKCEEENKSESFFFFLFVLHQCHRT